MSNQYQQFNNPYIQEIQPQPIQNPNNQQNVYYQPQPLPNNQYTNIPLVDTNDYNQTHYDLNDLNSDPNPNYNYNYNNNSNNNHQNEMMNSIILFVLGFFCCLAWPIGCCYYRKSKDSTAKMFGILSLIMTIVSIGSVVLVVFIYIIYFIIISRSFGSSNTNGLGLSRYQYATEV